MDRALTISRPGSMIGYVGVPHGVQFDGQHLFFNQVGMLGGPAPVRRFLPDLMDLVLTRKINPEKCSTSNCRSTTSPKATAPWTSAARSRRCCRCEASGDLRFAAAADRGACAAAFLPSRTGRGAFEGLRRLPSSGLVSAERPAPRRLRIRPAGTHRADVARRRADR